MLLIFETSEIRYPWLELYTAWNFNSKIFSPRTLTLTAFGAFYNHLWTYQCLILCRLGDPCVDIYGNMRDVGEEWSEDCDCNVCYGGPIQNHTVTYGFVASVFSRGVRKLNLFEKQLKVWSHFWSVVVLS